MIRILYRGHCDTLTEALHNCIDLYASSGMSPELIESDTYNVRFSEIDAKSLINGKLTESNYIDRNRF